MSEEQEPPLEIEMLKVVLYLVSRRKRRRSIN
jgi:hypothetical protein